MLQELHDKGFILATSFIEAGSRNINKGRKITGSDTFIYQNLSNSKMMIFLGFFNLTFLVVYLCCISGNVQFFDSHEK